MSTINKFPETQRTFETRIKFVRDLFNSKYHTTAIMASCIQHKLGRSFENYLQNLDQSGWNLYGEDPIKVLKRIDK